MKAHGPRDANNTRGPRERLAVAKAVLRAVVVVVSGASALNRVLPELNMLLTVTMTTDGLRRLLAHWSRTSPAATRSGRCAHHPSGDLYRGFLAGAVATKVPTTRGRRGHHDPPGNPASAGRARLERVCNTHASEE